MFFKVFNLPEYMVGWCGEQFCEQVLLCRPLCCQKTLHFAPILSSYRPYQTSNIPQDQFFCTPIKTRTILRILWSRAFMTSTSKLVKISHSLQIRAFIAGLSNIYVSGQNLKKYISMNIKKIWLFLCNCRPFLCVLHTYRTQIGARRRCQFEVFSFHLPSFLKKHNT